MNGNSVGSANTADLVIATGITPHTLVIDGFNDFIIESELIVETDSGSFQIKQGDFVTFKDGLKCIWDIKKPVKKHYNFL